MDVTDAPSDVVVHVSRSGDGVVEFRPSPVFDLTSLAPREVLGAYYLEEDHTESYGVVAKDFLCERWGVARRIHIGYDAMFGICSVY